MTTKEQERETLKKIEALINSTEAHSYIRTAFDGCIEDAKENIENDFALSWKDRAINAGEKIAEQAQKLQEAEKAVKDATDRATFYANEQQRTLENNKRWQAAHEELTKRAEEQKAKIEEQAAEILKLKAKLYDFMTRAE